MGKKVSNIDEQGMILPDMKRKIRCKGPENVFELDAAVEHGYFPYLLEVGRVIFRLP